MTRPPQVVLRLHKNACAEKLHASDPTIDSPLLESGDRSSLEHLEASTQYGDIGFVRMFVRAYRRPS